MRPMIQWERYSRSAILAAFLTAARRCGATLVAWREPDARPWHLLVSFSQASRCPVSDTLPPGFVYSPFNAEDPRGFFLPAELLYVFQDNRLLDSRVGDSSQQQDFLAILETCLKTREQAAYYAPRVMDPAPNESKSTFLALVEQGIARIQQGGLQKVVLARTETIELAADFDLASLFSRLARQPNHFASLISSPTEGTWVGCTPELLLAIDSLVMRTVSLAGTIAGDRQWTDKEYREQGLVNDFIRDTLRRLDLTRVEETPLDNLSTGVFKHLKTGFHIHLDAGQQSAGMFARLLTLLHPTPALCGLPRTRALEFIRRHEGFERRLYAGFLGPCNIQPRRTRLYVNIRCMQLFARQGRLYLGAGITGDSDPEQEWQETCLKSRTLLGPQLTVSDPG